MRLSHVGIVVRSLDQALTLYRDALGMQVLSIAEVPEQGARVAFLDAGAVSIELLEPLGDKGPVAAWLRYHGPGVQHLALAAPDLQQAADRLRGKGMAVQERTQTGANGEPILFVHPDSAQGTLLEIVEAGEEGADQ